MTKKIRKNQAYQLHEDGYSYGEIAKLLNSPKSTIHRWVTDRQQQIEDIDFYEQDVNTNTNLENGTYLDEYQGDSYRNFRKNNENDTKWNEFMPDNALSTFENWKKELENWDLVVNNTKESCKSSILEHVFQSYLLPLHEKNEKLQREHKLLVKRLKISEEINTKMSHDLETTRIENGFLEEKVKSLSKITGTSAEFTMTEIQLASVTTRLINSISDYLELEGQKCSLQSIQVQYKHILELQSAFIPFELIKFRKSMVKETIRTFSKITRELEDVLRLFKKEDVDEIELILDEKFKGEMEDWIEGCEKMNG